MRIAVIADTHLPRRGLDLPESAWDVVRRSDGCIHAGDVTTSALIARLRDAGPLWAVRGNNDHEPALRALPERLEWALEGVPLAMVHDSGPAHRRRERLRSWFPGARAVVFGHSHMPVCDDDGGLLLLNPGSPTDRRRMPSFTMAVLTLRRGEVSAELLDLGPERAAPV